MALRELPYVSSMNALGPWSSSTRARVARSSSRRRRSELLGLHWADIDLDAKRLSVTRALIAPRYRLQFSDVKTEAGRRSVALDDITVGALRKHRRRQTEERLAFGPGWGEHEQANDLVLERNGGLCKTRC